MNKRRLRRAWHIWRTDGLEKVMDESEEQQALEITLVTQNAISYRNERNTFPYKALVSKSKTRLKWPDYQSNLTLSMNFSIYLPND